MLVRVTNYCTQHIHIRHVVHIYGYNKQWKQLHYYREKRHSQRWK